MEFPELTIVGGHIGYPWTDEAIALATKHERLYTDTSAYTPARYPAALVEFLRGHGRRKVLWGSNFPMIAPQQAISGVDALGLDEEAKGLFLSGNAGSTVVGESAGVARTADRTGRRRKFWEVFNY